MVPLFRPDYDKRESDAVGRVLSSCWSGLGPETEKFEQEFAKHVGSRYAVGTNSCTSSLLLCLSAIGVGEGDEVIIPSLSFISTAHAVFLSGATPVFCDVEPTTLMLNRETVRPHVSSRTKAIIAVNYGGTSKVAVQPFDYSVPVIWDCAHASGIGGGLYGSAYLACWSFHSVKNISCGDGGMVTTNSSELTKKIRNLRWLGIDKSTWDRIEHGGAAGAETTQRYHWEYECAVVGIKGHMNDLAAAIGRVQLHKLGGMQRWRRRIAERYIDELSELEGVECMDDAKGHGLHLFVIRTDESRRDPLVQHLMKNDVQVGVHYKPMHLFECYRSLRKCELPVVEREWKRLVSLPMHACLNYEDVDFVVGRILEFFKR